MESNVAPSGLVRSLSRRSMVPIRCHHNKLRTGRILMARGRDATDIAIVTSFGPCTLAGFKVITHRSLHLLQCSHANQTHRLMRHAKLLRESPQRDRDLGKPARLDDVALPSLSTPDACESTSAAAS